MGGSERRKNALMEAVQCRRKERAGEEVLGADHAGHLETTALIGLAMVENEDKRDAARVAHVLKHDRVKVSVVALAELMAAKDAAKAQAEHCELTQTLGSVLSEQVQRHLDDLGD